MINLLVFTKHNVSVHEDEKYTDNPYGMYLNYEGAEIKKTKKIKK